MSVRMFYVYCSDIRQRALLLICTLAFLFHFIAGIHCKVGLSVACTGEGGDQRNAGAA